MNGPPDSLETVVLLHGIGATGRRMWIIARRLRQKGYQVLNLTYPSRRLGLDRLAAHLQENVLSLTFWRDAGRVHFVTHSMGGLVVRRYLENYRDILPPEKLGRVVMLGPPNGGSEVADLLHRLWLYRKIFGPAGQELTTAAAKPASLYYEAGIIAGTSSWPYPEAFFLFREPSDGRITVARTKLTGMKDHVTVRSTHSLMMFSPHVLRHILAFIQTGSFEGHS